MVSGSLTGTLPVSDSAVIAHMVLPESAAALLAHDDADVGAGAPRRRQEHRAHGVSGGRRST